MTQKFLKIQKINPFQSNVTFLYPLKRGLQKCDIGLKQVKNYENNICYFPFSDIFVALFAFIYSLVKKNNLVFLSSTSTYFFQSEIIITQIKLRKFNFIAAIDFSLIALLQSWHCIPVKSFSRYILTGIMMFCCIHKKI